MSSRNSGDSLPAIVLTVVIAFVVLAAGVAVLNPVVEQSTDDDGSGERIQTNVVATGDTGVWYRIGDYSGVDPDVTTSRGYAVNLTGAPDSYVKSDDGIDIATDDTWTVSTWARADPDATPNTMTAVDVAGRLSIRYNQTSAEWVAWYYDDGTGNSYELAASDASQPGNYSNVQVVANGTHIQIYHNNTAGDSAALTTSSVADAPANTSEWDGRLEEIRTFDDALNATTRQELVESPVHPQAGTNRTARVMFDEPSASQQPIFFSDATMAQQNVTFSAGFDGQQLTEGQYAFAGSDYEWMESGPKIRLLDGGDADGAPVVYVDYTEQLLSPATWTPTATTVIGLAAILPMLLLIGYLLAVLRRAQ